MDDEPNQPDAGEAVLSTALAPLDSRYRPLADSLVAGWAADPSVLRVALGGSLGAGRADAFSDLDLSVATTDEAACDALVAGLPAAVDAVYSSVLGRGPVRVFTAVTRQWLRVDVVCEPIAVAAGRPRAPEAVVLDRSGAEAQFRSAPALAPPPDLRDVVESFLRILGLLPVSAGRGEGFVGTKGIMLLRDHLVDLFAIENGGASISGVKRLNPTLTAEQVRLLEGQPPLLATPSSLIEGSVAAADAFLPRARAAAARLGVDWPSEFEAATREHLRATMGLELAEGSGTIQP